MAEEIQEKSANMDTSVSTDEISDEVQEQIDGKNESAENKFLLKDRFEIDFNEPIAWLDNNGVKAFRVRDKINSKVSLFSLICDNKTSARNSLIDEYKNINHPNLMPLIEYGVVKYIPEKTYNMALVYQTPLGGKLIQENTDFEKFIDNKEELKDVLLRFVSIVEELKSKGITHRAIRLENLYYNDEEKTEIVLGDCLASFPAFHQPPAYESIESLMVFKEGRGDGSYKDDIYAAGIVAISLYLGKKPYEDLSAPEVLRIKVKNGTYQSLVGNDKISSKYAVILKKIIEDKKNSRWSHIEIYNAFEKKVVPKITLKPSETSKKSITINGEKIYAAHNVAFAILNNQKEASDLINDGKMIEWVKSGLQNEDLTDKIEKIIIGDKSRAIDDDITAIKVAIILNPNLPIIFRGISLFPDAIAKTIFYTLNTQSKNLNIFNELLSTDLIKTWYKEQRFIRTPNNTDFKTLISKNEYGYGLHRVVYEMDDDLPCTSSLLGGHYITSHTRILRALDSYYNTTKTEELPYDKNLIAYLYSKMGKTVDKIIARLNNPKESEKIAALVKLYALMQVKYGPAKLPNLTRWLINSSSIVIKTYHNLKYRKFIEKEIVKVMKNGNINTIQKLLDSDEAKYRDNLEYNIAVNTVNSLILEKNTTISNGQKIINDAVMLGRNFAAVLAVTIMIISFLFNIIKWI